MKFQRKQTILCGHNRQLSIRNLVKNQQKCQDSHSEVFIQLKQKGLSFEIHLKKENLRAIFPISIFI